MSVTEEAVLQVCSVLTEQNVLECIEDSLGLIEYGILLGDKELVLKESLALGNRQRPEVLNMPKMSMPEYMRRRYNQVMDQADRFLAA